MGLVQNERANAGIGDEVDEHGHFFFIKALAELWVEPFVVRHKLGRFRSQTVLGVERLVRHGCEDARCVE